MNRPDSIDRLDNGDTVEVEKVIRAVLPPLEGKKAMRVLFFDDPRTFYTIRAFQLVKAGDRVSVTIKASEYGGSLYYWIESWTRLQKEELPLT